MSYGLNGELQRIIENSKFTTSFEYDKNGNFVQIIDHLGLISDFYVKEDDTSR